MPPLHKPQPRPVSVAAQARGGEEDAPPLGPGGNEHSAELTDHGRPVCVGGLLQYSCMGYDAMGGRTAGTRAVRFSH